MEFEKWQALGNDYVILEERALPFQLTPARVRAICAAHTGVFSDGVLLLSDPDDPECVARVRIFNPDGSEAEVSGNGAREAILYMRRRGWTEAGEFSIQTAAGILRPTILSATTCRVEMGRARTQSPDYPTGDATGRGELSADGHHWSFQHVNVGNPQCAISVETVERLAALDLSAIGPGIEHHELFPNRTNVSWFTALEPGRIRARIFERGVGETAASGTGATGAAVSHALDGAGAGQPASVSVVLDGGELEVELGEDLSISLTGRAEPVFAGELSEEFMEVLRATE
ncbi:MAG TPA: diaminopimelate epimerase [Solirubrobacteraceae bacterium]